MTCYRLAAHTPVLVSDRLAGVLVGDDRSLKFVAVDQRFRVLDGSRFARPEAARRAAVRLAKASAELDRGEFVSCRDRLGGRQASLS